MIRLRHAPMEIDGHKLMVDVPWFMTEKNTWDGMRICANGCMIHMIRGENHDICF